LSIFISRKKSGKDYRQQIFEQLKTKNKHQNNIWSDKKKTKESEINKKHKATNPFQPTKPFQSTGVCLVKRRNIFCQKFNSLQLLKVPNVGHLILIIHTVSVLV
jgi:hypothetical protein